MTISLERSCLFLRSFCLAFILLFFYDCHSFLIWWRTLCFSLSPSLFSSSSFLFLCFNAEDNFFALGDGTANYALIDRWMVSSFLLIKVIKGNGCKGALRRSTMLCVQSLLRGERFPFLGSSALVWHPFLVLPKVVMFLGFSVLEWRHQPCQTPVQRWPVLFCCEHCMKAKIHSAVEQFWLLTFCLATWDVGYASV